jgi:hypothetical protein
MFIGSSPWAMAYRIRIGLFFHQLRQRDGYRLDQIQVRFAVHPPHIFLLTSRVARVPMFSPSPNPGAGNRQVYGLRNTAIRSPKRNPHPPRPLPLRTSSIHILLHWSAPHAPERIVRGAAQISAFKPIHWRTMHPTFQRGWTKEYWDGFRTQ